MPASPWDVTRQELGDELRTAPLGTRIEIQEPDNSWVGARVETNLQGVRVGVYDKAEWKWWKPELESMIHFNRVRISPLPAPPKKKKKPRAAATPPQKKKAKARAARR